MIRRSRLESWCWTILAIGAANWFTCTIILSAIGGDGWLGFVEDGRYYVGNHGVYTEVSRAVFIYTNIHVVVSVVLWLLALLAGVLAALLREHRGMLLRESGQDPGGVRAEPDGAPPQ